MSRFREVLRHISSQKKKIIKDFTGDKLKLAELVKEQERESDYVLPIIIEPPVYSLDHIKDYDHRAAYVLFKSNNFPVAYICRTLHIDHRTLKGIIAKWST